MTLFEGNENQIYEIKDIQTQDEALKHRLFSLGITKNSHILLERFSSNKATLAIQANQTKIALRDSEAKRIIVEAL